MAVHKRFLEHQPAAVLPPAPLIFGVGRSIAAGLLGSAQPAAAQQGYGNFFSYQGADASEARRAQEPKRTARRNGRQESRNGDKKKDAKPAAPTGPVYAVVSPSPTSTSPSTTAPAASRARACRPAWPDTARRPGVFSVIGKERWHHSNIYSGAPMPFMQRITWSGVAMHAGVVPGYPASHGCIRLPPSFAPQLFGMTKMGARVLVAPRDVEPVEFSHSFLPLPKMQPAPVLPANAQQASTGGEASVELASMGTHRPPA